MGRVESRIFRAGCPRVLRFASDREWLTGVSWSNLRIHAFPGIDWSRTPGDALRYIRSRLVPTRRALADVASTVRRQPHLERVPWYGVSHGKRIVRWLVSRASASYFAIRAVVISHRCL